VRLLLKLKTYFPAFLLPGAIASSELTLPTDSGHHMWCNAIFSFHVWGGRAADERERDFRGESRSTKADPWDVGVFIAPGQLAGHSK